jgi:hypothetical protein
VPPSAASARAGAADSAPRPFDDVGVVAAFAARELVSHARAPARVPGRFDEQPADVGVADFGDRPARAALAGRTFRWHQADEAHERLHGLKAREVADPDGESQRGERVDVAQAAQATDEVTDRFVVRDVGELALELLDAVDEIDRVQVGRGTPAAAPCSKDWLPSHMRRAAATTGPGRGGRGAARTAHPRAVAHAVEPGVLVRADEIADTFKLDARSRIPSSSTLGGGSVPTRRLGAAESFGKQYRIGTAGLDRVRPQTTRKPRY